MLDILRQQIQVDYSEAVNQLQPEVNAVLWGSQDVGEPSSKKGDSRHSKVKRPFIWTFPSSDARHMGR